MPRKYRLPKVRRDRSGLRAAALHYLETGEIKLQPGDNEWMTISLMAPEARAARAAWEQGDEAGARELLGRCPGHAGWYLG